ESATNSPTNSKESSIGERKENPYISNKANKNKTIDNSSLPRYPLDKENKNKEYMKPNSRNNREGANKKQQTYKDSVHSMLLQILGRLNKLEDQSSSFQTIHKSSSCESLLKASQTQE
ncbi:8265_t:CDS:1, partial [Dentiscutata erythropus]